MSIDNNKLKKVFLPLILIGLLVFLFFILLSQAFADDFVLSSQPLANTVNGYAKVEWEYDDAGNVILQRYLNAELLPVVGPEGYAEVHRDWDSDNHLIREEYLGIDGMPLLQAGGFTAIEQTWKNDVLVSRKYLDSSGLPVDRVDGYSEALWKTDENGVTSVVFQTVSGEELDPTGLNLATNIKYGNDGWSQWMIPNRNAVNDSFNIGNTALCGKRAGVSYTCQLEIEFKDVTAYPGQEFRFWTQGAVDNGWTISNLWTTSLVYLPSPPQDGIYQYTVTTQLNEAMAMASSFDIGFRCDYWGSGMFRVRNVKIEIGEQATEWSPEI